LAASREARAIEPAEMQPHRQTVADIRAVSGAIIAWITDLFSLPAGRARLGSGLTTVDVAHYQPITAGALEALLVPAYIADVPELDGWGNPYEYYLDLTPATATGVTLIRSAGEDGLYEGDVYTMGDVEGLWEDLVWADNNDIRRPGTSLTDLRTKAVRARAEVARVGNAMMSWLTDLICFARPVESADGSTIDLDLFPPITHGDLETELVPFYLLAVPENDPWGSPYDYYLDNVCPPTMNVAAIRSRGKDTMAEGTVYTPETFPPSAFDRDLVWANGLFVRQPDDLAALVFLDDFEAGDARHWSALTP
jgi:hypothetical protein